MTILNTIDHLGKFDGKSQEGFFLGYSVTSKAFRVYKLATKKIEENLHVNFLETKPNVKGTGPEWMFDLDYLTNSMGYHPIASVDQTNHDASSKEANDSADSSDDDAEDVLKGDDIGKPLCTSSGTTYKHTSIKKDGQV